MWMAGEEATPQAPWQAGPFKLFGRNPHSAFGEVARKPSRFHQARCGQGVGDSRGQVHGTALKRGLRLCIAAAGIAC
jgi:hypothetical protein